MNVQEKLISIWKVEHQDPFWNRGTCNFEITYCYDYKDVPQFSACTRLRWHRKSWAVGTDYRSSADRTNTKLLEWSWDNFAPLPLLRPSSHYRGGIWKRRLHSENASDVFRPQYAGGISVREMTLLHRFRKAPFSDKMYSVHTKTKSRRFPNSSGLIWRARFRDGLVWTVGLTLEIRLRFQIPPA